MRITTPGDMWVCGVNCWGRAGYTHGTPVLNSCLNISDAGAITADYKLMTPLLYDNTMTGNGDTQVTLEDNVISTGNLVVHGSSNNKPFWVAGKVDGTSVTTLSTNGRYGSTVSRASGYAAGVYYINVGSNPYNDAHYMISVSNQASLYCKLWESSIPTVNGCYIVWYTNATTPGNAIFHFPVIA